MISLATEYLRYKLSTLYQYNVSVRRKNRAEMFFIFRATATRPNGEENRKAWSDGFAMAI